MATKVRVNLANQQEVLELPGLGPAQAAAIIEVRSEHGPIKDADQLATILRGYPLTETLRERSDFSPSGSTAPRRPPPRAPYGHSAGVEGRPIPARERG